MSLSATLPAHLAAMQALVDRCPTPEQRKEFIIAALMADAIGKDDTALLITANQLETA